MPIIISVCHDTLYKNSKALMSGQPISLRCHTHVMVFNNVSKSQFVPGKLYNTRLLKLEGLNMQQSSLMSYNMSLVQPHVNWRGWGGDKSDLQCTFLLYSAHYAGQLFLKLSCNTISLGEREAAEHWAENPQEEKLHAGIRVQHF